MIPVALAAALASLAVAVRDCWRHPSDGLAVMRTTVAAAWAAVWGAYGINPAGFPQPELATVLLVAGTWAISLLVIPGPPTGGALGRPWRWDHPANRIAFLLLLGASAAVVLWDLVHILPRMSEVGVANALVGQRTDRTNKAGAYALPGAEVAHAISTVTGVLGYAIWVRNRRLPGFAGAVLGLLSSLSATGRWDLVSYGLWCFAVDVLLRPGQPGRRVLASTARLFALLAVLFVVHGKLLGKVEVIGDFARMGAEERIALANSPASLGFGDGRAGEGRAEESGFRQVQARECPRWVEGARTANARFRAMSSLASVGTSYFAGPIAAFDRMVCEGGVASRTVIFYWPQKIGRVLGLVPRRPMPVVDPFVDIGVPFNNFTVFFPFLSELGAVAGLAAWLMTAFVVRGAARWSVRRASLPLVVASAAPLPIAVRTPWINAFFDGTLVVWVGVCLALAAIAWRTDGGPCRSAAPGEDEHLACQRPPG